MYEAVGDGSALAFFRTDRITGAIFIERLLLEDSLVLYTVSNSKPTIYGMSQYSLMFVYSDLLFYLNYLHFV